MIGYTVDDYGHLHLHDVGCALPDLGLVLRVSAAVAAAGVVVAALVIWGVNRLRVW